MMPPCASQDSVGVYDGGQVTMLLTESFFFAEIRHGRR
jgi:hypothetical protein